MSGFLCTMVGATFGVAAAAEVIRLKKGITAVGNAQIDTAQSKFGGSSYLGDGTGDYLNVYSNGAFAYSSDFTIEGWVRVNSLSSARVIFSQNTLGNLMSVYASTDGTLIYYTSSASRITGSANNITTNTWFHVALSRSGNSTKLFVNGTQIGSTYTDNNSYTDGLMYIGSWNDGTSSWSGHIDEFRVSNTARYTTGFTPSTTPFVNDANTLLLLHMDGTDATTYFEDDNGIRAPNSIIAVGNAQVDTAQSKFGGSSALFDGTGDYLIVGNTVDADMALTGNNWTVEYWARINSHAGQYQGTIGIWDPVSPTGSVWYVTTNAYNSTSKMGISYVYGTNSLSGDLSFGSALSTGVWQHHAFVRNGNTLTAYLDGVSQGTHDMTGRTIDITGYNSSSNTTLKMTIGALTAGSGAFNGHLDEIRISNVARYTAAFTAPTEPFVNDANTVLLIHADGTDASTVFRDDNGLIPATYTSDVVAFDGTGDYYDATSLSSSVTADSKYALIALNLYWAGGNNLQHPFNIRLGTGSGDYGFWVWINGGRSQLKFVTGTGSVPGSIYENTENSLTANAWNQIVIWVDTTSSTTSQIWVNGNSKAYSNDGFPTGALFNWTNTASTVKIGQKNTSQTGDGNDFNGRISQVYLSAASSFPGIEYFWDKSTNRPKDFGTDGTATGLAQPLIYHYGGTSTFPTNRGNFASYTLTANGNVATNSANTIYARARRQRGIVANGNAQIDTAQSKFGGSSALFDGTGDYIEINPGINWHSQTTGTIEFFFRLNSTVPFAQGLFSQCIEGQAVGLQLLTVNNRLYLYKSAVSGNAYEAYNVNIVTGQFYHIAIVKESATTVKFYVDGTLRHTDSSASGYTDSTAKLWFGRGFGLSSNLWDSTRYDLNGWIDEIRISNTARYTAGFTPTTTPFQNDANTVLLLHMDGTDASTVFFDDNGRDTTPT